jgi:hypothetical protein
MLERKVNSGVVGLLFSAAVGLGSLLPSQVNGQGEKTPNSYMYAGDVILATTNWVDRNANGTLDAMGEFGAPIQEVYAGSNIIIGGKFSNTLKSPLTLSYKLYGMVKDKYSPGQFTVQSVAKVEKLIQPGETIISSKEVDTSQFPPGQYILSFNKIISGRSIPCTAKVILIKEK